MTRPFIMVAPTGARRSKVDHLALPITIDEIVAEASACAGVGADALHLHIRDDHGAHSLDPARYREVLAALYEAVPRLRIQVTTESAGRFDVETQLACLEELIPDWASVSIREVARSPSLAQRLYHGCAERGTLIQHILYDSADLFQFQAWLSAGVVSPSQNCVILVLGRYQNAQIAVPYDLEPLLTYLPSGIDWMACAFGPNEHLCLASAAAKGGAVRVGFENSLTGPDGRPHASNAASVAALIKRLEGDHR